MIQSLSIRNFQSHKKSTLVFDKGVNVIIGKTDSGKSAVIRALRWVLSNSPSGDAFRSWDGGETKVSIRLTDSDKRISRVKGTKNMYVLDKKEFTGIGNEVPMPIKDLLNISDINMQAQLDSPFLLSATSGEVAKFFNKVAHLDKIDLGQSNIKKWMRKIEQSILFNTKTIEENTEKIESHNYLFKMEIDVEELETLQIKMDKQYQRRANLKNIVDSLTVINKELEELKEWKEIEVFVLKLVDQTKDLTKQIKVREGLFLLTQKLAETNTAIAASKQIIGAENKVNLLVEKTNNLAAFIVSFNSLIDFVEKYEQLENNILHHSYYLGIEEGIQTLVTLSNSHKTQSKKYEDLENLIILLETNEENIKKYVSLLQKMQKEYQADFPDICPFCGSNAFHKHE